MALSVDKKYIGILLSGGQSRRFGSPKAFAKFNDEYFYMIALNILRPFVEEIIIVSHPDLTERFIKMGRGHVIEDVKEFLGKGPLAGIYSGMSEMEADSYIILPCDMPLLTEETLRWLIWQYEQLPCIDGIVPSIGGKVQPLVSIFKKHVKATIYSKLRNNERRVMEIFQDLNIKRIALDELPDIEYQFRNINSVNELDSI